MAMAENQDDRVWGDEETWMFSDDFFINETPSRKDGISFEEETQFLHKLILLIQCLGQQLHLNQQCINTGSVYLRRVFTQTSMFPFNSQQPRLQVVACTCLYLAAKSEESPRPLELVVRWKYRLCGSHLTTSRSQYSKEKETNYMVTSLESFKKVEEELLIVLGFDLTVDLPHHHVLAACKLFKSSEPFTQTAHFMATSSLKLTNLNLRYGSLVVAGACLWLTFKWSKTKLAKSSEGKEWYQYVDHSLTQEVLERVGNLVMDGMEKYPEMLIGAVNPQQHQKNTARRNYRLEGRLTLTPNADAMSPLPESSSSGASASAVSRTEQTLSRTQQTVPRTEQTVPRTQQTVPMTQQGRPRSQGDTNPPAPKKLPLQKYHQRVRQSGKEEGFPMHPQLLNSAPHPPEPKPSHNPSAPNHQPPPSALNHRPPPWVHGTPLMYPMHPEPAKTAPQPQEPNPSHHPSAHGTPPPHLPVEEAGQSHHAQIPEQSQVPEEQHQRVHQPSRPAQPVEVNVEAKPEPLYPSSSSSVQGNRPSHQQQLPLSSPVVKKEGENSASAANQYPPLSLKKARVVPHDPKLVQSQVPALFTKDVADSRKGSYSRSVAGRGREGGQSQEDAGSQVCRQSLVQGQLVTQVKDVRRKEDSSSSRHTESPRVDDSSAKSVAPPLLKLVFKKKQNGEVSVQKKK